MGAREPLSVVLITHDEERNLRRCLESVAWADEIVVVDSGSTDRTVDVARVFTDRVFREPWRGFAAQKNAAVDHASHRWVLSLDADEWLTEAGAAEIRRELEAPRAEAYAVNRRTAFSGAFLSHAWTPDWQIRLFRKDRARFVGGHVHESVGVAPGGRVVRLRERMPHLAYRSIHAYVARMNRYTDLAAETLVEEGARVPWPRLVLSPPATFLKCYVLRGGFRDGLRGLVVSAGSAFYVLLKYAKLWERRRGVDRRFAEVVGATAEDPRPGEAVGPPRQSS